MVSWSMLGLKVLGESDKENDKLLKNIFEIALASELCAAYAYH